MEFAFDKQSASLPFNTFQAFMTNVIKRFRSEVYTVHKANSERLQTLDDLKAGISAQRMPTEFEDATTDASASDPDTSCSPAKKLKTN